MRRKQPKPLSSFQFTLRKTSLQIGFQLTSLAGDAQKKFGEYLALAAGGFPSPIENPDHPITLKNASVKAAVPSRFLQQLFNNTFSHEIPINQDLITSISINGSKNIVFDANLKSIGVSFSDGEIKGKVGNAKITYAIKACDFEFLPSISYREKNYYLDFCAVVTHLDLKNVNNEIDKMIAWALQTDFLNKDTIESIKITELLARNIEDTITG